MTEEEEVADVEDVTEEVDDVGMPAGNTGGPWLGLVGTQGTTPHEGNSPCGYVLHPPDHPPPPDDATSGAGVGDGGGAGMTPVQMSPRYAAATNRVPSAVEVTACQNRPLAEVPVV